MHFLAVVLSALGLATWGYAFFYFIRKAMTSHMVVQYTLTSVCVGFIAFHGATLFELITGVSLMAKLVSLAVSVVVSLGIIITIRYVEHKVRSKNAR